MTVLIVDTGVLLAAADNTDRAHTVCADLVAMTSDTLVTTALVVAEAGYMIERQLGSGAEAQFYPSVAAGDVLVEVLTAGDFVRIAELIEVYADFPIGGTDASLVAIAERLGVTRIATLDRRHFSAVKPTHCPAFRLVP